MSLGGVAKAFRFWMLIIAGFSLFSVTVVSPKYALNVEMKRRIARIEAEMESLLEKEKRIEIEEEALREDPFYAEVLARKELHLAKPGELQIDVPEYSPDSGKVPAPGRSSFEFYMTFLGKHRLLQYFLMACSFGMIMAAILLFGETPHKQNAGRKPSLSALKKAY